MEMQTTTIIRTVKKIGQRPTHTPTGETIPANWIICNAPRPLDGDMAWEGEPFRGALYVAIDPTGPDAGRFLRNNAELHGVILEYVDEETALTEALAVYLAEFPEEADEIDPNDRHQRRALMESWYEQQRG